MNTLQKCPVCAHNSYEIFSNMSDKIFQCEFCKIGFLYPLPLSKFLEKFYSKNYFKREDDKSGYKNYKKM